MIARTLLQAPPQMSVTSSQEPGAPDLNLKVTVGRAGLQPVTPTVSPESGRSNRAAYESTTSQDFSVRLLLLEWRFTNRRGTVATPLLFWELGVSYGRPELPSLVPVPIQLCQASDAETNGSSLPRGYELSRNS